MSLGDIAKVVLPPVIAAVAAVLIAFLTARMKVNEMIKNFELSQRALIKNFELAQWARDDEARLKARVQYLDPLRVAAADLRGKLQAIHKNDEDEDVAVRDGGRKYCHAL